MTERLDAALAVRGLARSRTQAAQLIVEGMVSVDGHLVVKPSHRVTDEAILDVAATDHYVSRAAHKLLAGLDAFEVSVAGRVALDMGASTGGFTQVLRERGARPVLAVDVGHGQLDPLLSLDPEVVSVEGFNVRYMDADGLASATGIAAQPSVIAGDLSFISLTLVLPPVAAVAGPGADIVLLIKPQFEVGRTAVKGGLVTDPDLRADAVATVLWAAWDVGLRTAGLIASPLKGEHGNQEYVVHLAADRGSDPSEWRALVSEVTSR